MNVFWICYFINQIYPLRTSRNSNFIRLQKILILNRLLHEGKVSDIYSRSEKNEFKLIKGIRKLYEKLRDILCTTILLICIDSDGKDDDGRVKDLYSTETRGLKRYRFQRPGFTADHTINTNAENRIATETAKKNRIFYDVQPMTLLLHFDAPQGSYRDRQSSSC